MIFVIARTQTKDTMTIQIKLNEIIAVLNGANNNLINIESLSEKRIVELFKRYEIVAKHVQNQPEEFSLETIMAHEITEDLKSL